MAQSCRAWVSAAALFGAALGCGYSFTQGGALPAGLSRVRVDAFVDRTAEGDLGARVAAATRRRIREVNPSLVAGIADPGAARLIGSIEAVRFRTVPMGRGGRVVPGLYQLKVVASARIVRPGGALIQDLGTFSEGVEYPVEAGVGPAEEARRRALTRAARALGSRIAESALVRF